jgi:hypothetical protein
MSATVRAGESAVEARSAGLKRENPILFVGAPTLALSIVGVGKQEAFQLLWNASAIFYALTYLVMFAIRLAGEAPVGVKASALSALLMTLLFIALSIVPIVQVERRLLFALKMSALIVVLNAAGAAIFLGKIGRHGAHRHNF